jgi:cytochrome c5
MIKNFDVLAGGAALLLSTIAIAQSTDQSATESPRLVSTSDQGVDLKRGAKAWADHCGRCHNLRSPSELSENAWDVSVTHMRTRANLPGDLADDIEAFLKYSAQSKSIDAAPLENQAAKGDFAYLQPGNVERGRDLYAQTCVACHGAKGQGAFDGVPDLTLANGRFAKPDHLLLANVINGFQSPGSLMAMPPKGGNPDLSEQDLADTLAYMRVELLERTETPERR